MSTINRIKNSFFAVSAFLVIVSSVAITNFETVSASAPGAVVSPTKLEHDPSALAYPAVDYSTVPGVYTQDDGTHVQYIEFPPLHIIISNLNK